MHRGGVLKEKSKNVKEKPQNLTGILLRLCKKGRIVGKTNTWYNVWDAAPRLKAHQGLHIQPFFYFGGGNFNVMIFAILFYTKLGLGFLLLTYVTMAKVN